MFSAFPAGALPTALGWVAILTELTLVVLLLMPRYLPLAIWLGVAYHTGLVVLTRGNTFGMFWYALAASYIALMWWPADQIRVGFAATSRWQPAVARMLSWLDFDRRYALASGDRLVVESGDATWTGVRAIWRLLLYLPPAYLLAVVVFSTHVRSIALTFVLLGALAWGKLPRRRRRPLAMAR